MADLILKNIHKRFGPVKVLEDISLEVPDGEFTILLGPSGCGKSTLLRIIAGLEEQSGGAVIIGGRGVDRLSARERDIAMVFQSYALYPHLTVRENLAFGLKMRKESRSVIGERIGEAAQLLGIEELLDRKPRELSGGQRQRVAMGRAIVRKPKLFLFDEPLSNLDARLRVSMRVELKKLHQRLKTTMIYVTHDQVEAMTLGQKIVVMEGGRIRQADTAERIYAEPADTFVAGFIGSPAMNLMAGRLRHQNGRWALQAGRTTLLLPPVSGKAALPDGEEAVLGIRPEDLGFEAPAGAAACLDGTVEVVEDLGADRLVHVDAGDWRLVARVPRAAGVREAGAALRLHLPAERLHLFIGERRLEINPFPA